MARNPSMLCFAIACIGSCLLAASYSAEGQQTTTANQVSPQPKIKCPHPADPHRRQRGCNDEDFDWDETLAHGWNDLRQEMKRIGITPTASYTGALQTM